MATRHETEDYRWVSTKDGSRLTWVETVKAASAHYGTFCGRWHDNEYWADLAKRAETMTEEEAEKVVREYEREADADLARWQMYQ